FDNLACYIPSGTVIDETGGYQDFDEDEDDTNYDQLKIIDPSAQAFICYSVGLSSIKVDIILGAVLYTRGD
ncbi:MAG: hypothetical protein EZS28_056088, partial [Streblomastix strix]